MKKDWKGPAPVNPFEPHIEVLTSVKWPEDGNGSVELNCGGMGFVGMNQKDMFDPDRDWPAVLTPGTALCLWTYQFSRVAMIQRFDVAKNEWETVWFLGNDFQTREERKASDEAYEKAAKDASSRIKQDIDDGKSLVEIKNGLNGLGLTGFMVGWAMGRAIQMAENRTNAERIRIDWNAEHGRDDGEGVVNPAIMTTG